MDSNLDLPILDNERNKEEALFLSDVYFSMVELINISCKKTLLDMGLYHFNKPGKMIRSKIIYELGLSYNIPLTQLLKWSMACELLHEASLIHDDLQDGDKIRRDQKSVWFRYGAAQAINLGDFLLMLSYQPLGSLSSRLTSLHVQTSLKLVQGQANEFDMGKTKINSTLDLETKVLNESITDEYLDCVRGKTGALFASLATGISFLASTGEFERRYLDDIFLELGVIFQIQDDLLDLFGDKKRGAQGADIGEGKCSVLIAIHFDSYPEDIAYINSILEKPRNDTTIEDIENLKCIFIEKGTLNSCIVFLKTKINELKAHMSDRQDSGYNADIVSKVLTFIEQILAPIQHVYEQNRYKFESEIDALDNNFEVDNQTFANLKDLSS